MLHEETYEGEILLNTEQHILIFYSEVKTVLLYGWKKTEG